MQWKTTAAAAVAALTAGASIADACTAILVGAKASTNGAPMTTHTADCSSCDFRLAKVPAQSFPEGAMRNVELAEQAYPRYIGEDRGPFFLPENVDRRFYNWTASVLTGTIPQVRKTFAYLDGVYGIINEHQVAIGESTCGARFWTKPITQGGQAMFDVAALTRVALERTKTAREAIQLMGDLAVQYGYYGAEWEGDDVYSEAGEALTVTDPTEAWMFHILPDDTGKSAIWAAQRVLDDHFSAVANQFVIHEIDLNQTDYFMASSNIYEVAIRNNIWTPDDNVPFDFTKVYSMPRADTHQYYSTRRIWRLFTLVDPAIKLSPYTDVFSSDYPFSIKAATQLSPQDIMRLQRDHYEGTAFDMTTGPDGGPYGDPDRYDPGVNGDLTEQDIGKGHFERAISIFRASYSFVSVLDPFNEDNGMIWYGQYAPHATTYTPVYTKVKETPTHLSTGSLFAFDRASSFWMHALVGNWAARFYKYAHPYVEKVQLELETNAMKLQPDILEQAAFIKKKTGDDAMVEFLTKQCAMSAEHAHRAFSDLFEYLVTVFHDGYQMTNFFTSHLRPVHLFYPKWWLQQVGFFAEKPTAQAQATDKSSTTATTTTTTTTKSSYDDDEALSFPFVSTLLVCMVSVTVGFFMGKRLGPKRSGYTPATTYGSTA